MGFSQGDYVFHPRSGICLVKGTETMDFGGENVDYYVLSPQYGEEKGLILRVPVSHAASLQTPMGKKDAMRLIESWPSGDCYVKDSKSRKNAYDSSLKSGDIEKMIPLLVGAEQRKARDGHLNSMDGQFAARAIPVIYGSLAYALGIAYEDVPSYISSHIE